MKPSLLSLPPEVASLVTSARRYGDPPEEARDELRARLGWAFTENGPTKVVHASGHEPLRAVQAPVGALARRDGWLPYLARAAAAMVLGHVPLALAGLGVVVASVPVSRLLLNRAAPDREVERRAVVRQHRATPLSPLSAATPNPAPPVAPSLTPPPEPFTLPEPPAPPPHTAPLLPAATRIAPARPEVPNDDLALAAERQLLEQARRALVRGDAIGALSKLNEHGARYPVSQLVEEREALSIQALLRAGRTAEAQLRGVEFRRQFPNSLLLRALGAALHEGPSEPTRGLP